ncbi:MAG TPA: sulfotransferase [Gammaproteobacteria bacterium]|nr:sulfotransferase [Gammaproteobacteria bacterium]
MTFSQACVKTAVRGLNLGGRTLRRLGVESPSLDADSLHRAAYRRASSTDYGQWDFAEPLERLLKSYRDEAALTTLGRITVRELIVSLLDNQLRMEAERAANSEIERQRIVAPVFIIGLPRTGTTHLHGLISEDRANRAPATWEVMYPAASRSPDDVARARSQADTRLGWADRLAPEFMSIHPIAADLPQECIAITAQAFMSIQFHTTHDVPSYQDWFENASQRLAFDFHHRFLQHQQAKSTTAMDGGSAGNAGRNFRPGTRWVLKAPGHLFALAGLLERYPDARIIHTHRDPLRVMASMASHATVLRRAFSDNADPRKIAADWADRWARALEKFLAVRDRAPAAQFLDVNFESIESDPLGTVERVYDFLGWPLTNEARTTMQNFLAANPKNKHGVHRYTLEQFGLNRDAQMLRFRNYCERFGIPARADR